MTKVSQDRSRTSRLTQNSNNASTSHDRKLRYRELLGDLSALDIEGADNDERVERTGTAVQEAKSLLAEGGVEERVRHPGEGYLDSRVLRATSDLAIRSSEAVSGNANTYDKHELAKHIKDHPRFWELCLPLELPPWPVLHGAFAAAAPAPRERAPRRRQERQAVAPLQAPEDVQKMDKTEEGSEMVSRVFRFIQKSYRNSGDKPLSYFHVALDPGSFARSVENIYYMSFLVRDGMIGVELDEEHELPFIRPIPTTQREANQEKQDNQFIVSLDMAGWQELVEAFRITEPLMVLKRS